MGKRIVAPKCPEQELRKKRKVGAEGFEPPSAGFHYGVSGFPLRGELPPAESMSHRSS